MGTPTITEPAQTRMAKPAPPGTQGIAAGAAGCWQYLIATSGLGRLNSVHDM